MITYSIIIIGYGMDLKNKKIKKVVPDDIPIIWVNVI